MHYYGSPLGAEAAAAAGPRFSLADTLKAAFGAAKQEALRRAGIAFAQTPEGQQAIQSGLEERARAAVSSAAPTVVPLMLAGLVGLFLLSRSRRR